MCKTKVTIITVCYNASDTIEKTILSVINQNYDNIEYIIIDGGSKDRTMDIVKKYEAKITKWVSESDKGIYDAMNKGIKMATGEWINFMNSGDIFVENDVLTNIFAHNNYSDSAVIYGDSVFEVNGRLYNSPAGGFSHLSMGFVHQSSFVHASEAKELLFDLKYHLAADYNMMLTLKKQGKVFSYVKTPISLYDTNGVSAQSREEHIYEMMCIENPGKEVDNRLYARRKNRIINVKLIVFSIVHKFFPFAEKIILNKKKDYEEYHRKTLIV